MSRMGQISLAAGSTTGNGGAYDNSGVYANHTVVVIGSAGISAGAVQLQGSLDNTNWVALGSPVTAVASANAVGNVANTPFQFIRAVVSTNIVGGTVSAWVASA